MKAKEIDRELREADPASSRQMVRLELGSAEAALAEAIVVEPGGDGAPEDAATPWPSAARRRRRGLLGLAGIATAAAAVVALLLLGGGASDSPSRAYGADLVRFAESTPLLLLDEPGWRVAYLDEDRRGPGMSPEGRMQFVTGSRASLGAHMTRADAKRHFVPPAVLRSRQSRVELTWKDDRQAKLVWHHGRLGVSSYDPYYKKRVTFYELGHAFKTTIPALGATAYVDPGAENRRMRKLGEREMVAIWTEGGNLLELRGVVPDLATFEERLGWLAKVDSQTWLEAMPASVVKAADHKAAVREMLQGIPVPDSFKLSRVPDAGLTTDRYQLGAALTGTVSCLWLRQWGEARRTGDGAAASEAVKAMATSRQWKILHEMAKEGAYPEVVWELAREMPSGVWKWDGKTHPLLPKAEGLGCARFGLPVLPRKQKLQRERGVPPPPR